jgi:hypothetical protein
MPNIFSYLVSSAYSGVAGLFGEASAVCANGQCSTSGTWIYNLISIPLAIFMIVCMWKIFTKAGRPGWAAIIPFYNTYVLLKIVNKPGWWLILYFIPLVNIVISIIVIYNLALVFGKGGGFAAGLIFLSFIFYPILAFGKAQYVQKAQPEISNPVMPGSEAPPPIPPQPGL